MTYVPVVDISGSLKLVDAELDEVYDAVFAGPQLQAKFTKATE
jgi:hypothetical protein